MQRLLSEFDIDFNNFEDFKSIFVRKVERFRLQFIVESVESMDSVESLYLMIKKYILVLGRRFLFGIKVFKFLDGYSLFFILESSELDLEFYCLGLGIIFLNQLFGDFIQFSFDSIVVQKVVMSFKSVFKFLFFKRRIFQNLKFRVIFEEFVVQME